MSEKSVNVNQYRKEILNNVEDRTSCLRRMSFVIDVNCGTQGEKG